MSGVSGAAGVVLAAVGGFLVLVILTAISGLAAAMAILGPAVPGGTASEDTGAAIEPPAETGSSAPGPGAAEIPAGMLALYRQAAPTCPGLDWSVLAGIGKVETDHGRSTLPGVHSGENSAGAAGPMQFLADTFTTVTARHPPPPGGAHPPSRYNPHDAVYTAAAYLCDSGARTTSGGPAPVAALRRAVFAYNHSDAYVSSVLAQAAAYRATAPDPASAPR